MSTPTWQRPEILTAAAGPQGPHVQAVFERAAELDPSQSLALRTHFELHGETLVQGAATRIAAGTVYAHASRAARKALAAAGRQEALETLLVSWSHLLTAVATDLFLQLHRASRPGTPGPTGTDLERAAAAAASGLEEPVTFAIIGLAARDLIASDGFNQNHYDALTTPWAWVFGPAHPDDAPAEAPR